MTPDLQVWGRVCQNQRRVLATRDFLLELSHFSVQHQRKLYHPEIHIHLNKHLIRV